MDFTQIAEQMLEFCAADGVELSDDLTQVEAAVLEQTGGSGRRRCSCT